MTVRGWSSLAAPTKARCGPDAVVVLGVTFIALAAVGEIIAGWAASGTAGLAAILVYGLGFGVLVWRRMPLTLTALIAALPLVTVEVGLGDVHMTLSTDKIALSVVAAAWIGGGLVAAPRLWKLPVVRWWVAYLGAVALSTLAHGLSLREVWSLGEQTVYAALFCFAIDAFDRDEVDGRRVLGAAGLAGGVVAGLGLVEAGIGLGGHDLALYFKQGTMATHYSFGSTIGHTNYLAAYLALVLAPLVALAAVADGRWRRGLMVASAAVIGLVLALARSIGALVGLSVGALAAAVLTFKAMPSRRAGLVLGLLLLIVTAVGATVAVRKLADSTNPIGVRVATLRIGLVAIAERPIAGFGADGYSRESNRLERQVFGRPLTEIRAPSESPSEPLSAHNAYLDLAVERGLPALATFVGLLGAVLLAGFRAYRRAHDRATKLLIGGLMAGLVAFMIQALTENLFAYSKVAAIFWILAAALVRARQAT